MPTKAGKAGVEETEAVAQVLFMQFCRDRFHAEGIDEVPTCEESTELDEFFRKECVQWQPQRRRPAPADVPLMRSSTFGHSGAATWTS